MGAMNFSIGNHVWVILQGPPAHPWPCKWCCKSGWDCLYWTLSPDPWGIQTGESSGPVGRAVFTVESVIQSTAPGPRWASSHARLKGMTCLPSDFEKCQKSVYKQCSSPNITGFSRLTSPSSSEKGSEIALRASAQQRVLWGVPISLCHLSAERARSSFQLPSAPLKGIAVLWWVLLLTYKNKNNNNKHT